MKKPNGQFAKGYNYSYKHGLSRTRFYVILAGMKFRCLAPTASNYKNYGGRGIKICDRWLKFENFKEDMYESYLKHVEEFGEKQTTLERIDINGNYEPNNCRWATCREQQINKSKSYSIKAISPSGEVFIVNNQREFARLRNLNRGNILSCLIGKRKHTKGWTFEYNKGKGHAPKKRK